MQYVLRSTYYETIMPLQTSSTGSWPPAYNLEEGIRHLSHEEQEGIVRDSIKQAIEDQIKLNLDVLVDGQVRDDIVSMFAAKLPGYREETFPFHVAGRIRPAGEPITVHDYVYAKELAGDRPVKAHLTGPMVMERVTAVGADSDYAGKHDPKLVMDIARALGQEAKFLVEAGAEVVQIDELILTEGVDLDLTFEAMKLIVEIGEIPFPAMHACGNVTHILDDILQKSPVKMVSIEGGWLHKPELQHIQRDYLKKCGKQLGVGCIGTSDYTIDKLDNVTQFLRSMGERLGQEHIWAAMPDCGLRPISRDMVFKKLAILVQAAHECC